MPNPLVDSAVPLLTTFPPRGSVTFLSIGCARRFGPDDRTLETDFIGTDEATEVWRSDPVTVGSKEDLFGVAVGPDDSTLVVSSGDIRIQPQLPVPLDVGLGVRRKIVAELHSLHLRNGNIELFAGEPLRRHLQEDCGLNDMEVASIFRRSLGAVISRSPTGDPTLDFPADNFFDVFFALKIPAGNDGFTTLYNRDPLVVVDLNLHGLPPLGRVTIPQFPWDSMDLYEVVRPPAAASATGDEGHGPIVAEGRGGCCAHSVSLPNLPLSEKFLAEASPEDQLAFASLSFDQLLKGFRSEEIPGISVATGASSLTASDRETPQPGAFRPCEETPFVDGVFSPHGVTQVSSTGLLVEFESTSRASRTRVVRNVPAIVADAGAAVSIDLDPPTSLRYYEPPQTNGIRLGANGGVTIDLDTVRSEHPDFYLVAMVGLEGMNRGPAAASDVRLRILLDGVSVAFADNSFAMAGESAAVHVDLQDQPRFLTLVATSTDPGGGDGALAFFELRGFGKLSLDGPD